jgi:hypothetical protein
VLCSVSSHSEDLDLALQFAHAALQFSKYRNPVKMFHVYAKLGALLIEKQEDEI